MTFMKDVFAEDLEENKRIIVLDEFCCLLVFHVVVEIGVLHKLALVFKYVCITHLSYCSSFS